MENPTTNEIIKRLEADWPRWQVWIVNRVQGGPVWCARRWDDHGQVLNAVSADELVGCLEEVAAGSETTTERSASPVSGAGWRVAPREDQIMIMTDHLTQAAGTVRGVLDDLTGLPVTASRAEQTAAILDNLAAELNEPPPT